MTNGDKYLKDGVDVEEFVNAIPRGKVTTWINGFGTCIVADKLKDWLNSSVKPTLTEDEKVILRATSFGNQEIILRDFCGNLWTRDTDEEDNDFCQFNYIFQFIKSRRRI